MREKTFNPLKIIRVSLAVILFVPVLALFLDFVDVLPYWLCKLLHLQILPAVFGGFGVLLVVYFLLTLLFGRVYCSVICPAGVLQDLFNRLSCTGKKKKNGAMRFRYHQPANVLRYSILGVTVLFAVFGFTELCLFLDPYSNFGRITTHLFRPVVMWVNNVLSGFLSSQGNYSLYFVSIDLSVAAFVSAITAFIVFAVMVYFRGRLFCNTICPVGALLSVISRYSLFRVTVDPKACNECKSCERACKAEAIDSQRQQADMSSCVTCFNCISSCNKKAIKYRFAPQAFFQKKVKPVFPKEAEPKPAESFSGSRRSFIATSATIASATPLLALAQKKGVANGKAPVTPPGSTGLERFKKYCTGCHLCVVQCPSRVLKPAGLQYGLDYMLKPYMSYENSYCNYTCTVCSEICPTHALQPLTVDQKKTTQTGIARFYMGRCVVRTEGNDCGACSEHCPTQAVHMVPYRGTLTIPQVEPDLCIGCGGCESICPVTPVRAIVVIPNTIHQTATLPSEENVRKIEVDDFGF